MRVGVLRGGKELGARVGVFGESKGRVDDLGVSGNPEDEDEASGEVSDASPGCRSSCRLNSVESSCDS